MLKLPNVTLMSIDVKNPSRAFEAMRYSMRFVEFGSIVLATDASAASKLPLAAYGVQLHAIDETDVTIEGPSRVFYRDYELHQLMLPAHVSSTDFVLFQEWDACVLNPLAWDTSWLDTDYIGAVWPKSYQPGWPPITEKSSVGNSGFSLRSKKFNELVNEAVSRWINDPGMCCADQWACRTMRPWLESRGIVFGTEEQANKFSCEDCIYTGQFGFHGKNTKSINGWKFGWF